MEEKRRDVALSEIILIFATQVTGYIYCIINQYYAGEMTREEFPCEIVRRLPGGFMAEVYLAKLQNTRHFMVVKGVPQNAPASFRESLKREAEMLKKIRLENIPEVYGYFEEKEKRYFIMSYHEGSNLEELLSVTETKSFVFSKDKEEYVITVAK